MLSYRVRGFIRSPGDCSSAENNKFKHVTDEMPYLVWDVHVTRRDIEDFVIGSLGSRLSANDRICQTLGISHRCAATMVRIIVSGTNRWSRGMHWTAYRRCLLFYQHRGGGGKKTISKPNIFYDCSQKRINKSGSEFITNLHQLAYYNMAFKILVCITDAMV